VRSRLIPILLASALLAFLVSAGVVGWASSTKSSDYAFVPQAAQPVADVLKVVDAPPPEAGTGRVFFSSVGIRQATLYESWFGVRDGGRLVSKEEFIGPHGSREQENRIMDLTMDASQEVAVLVAARALGVPAKLVTEASLVISVEEDGPYARAGGRFGDVITAIDDRPASTVDEARSIISAKPVGSPVTLAVRRSRESLELTATTVEGPEGTPIIGVGLRPDYRIDTPLDVEFTVENIGGPSAGLAFALQIYSAEKAFANLGSQRVAATGALDVQGKVISVGGIKQKAIGAGRVGADLFLVPLENVAEAERHAPPGVRVVGVGSFREALAAIGSATAAA
jgi:PDZ domain-containing protein